jgi:hypothetical protein
LNSRHSARSGQPTARKENKQHTRKELHTPDDRRAIETLPAPAGTVLLLGSPLGPAAGCRLSCTSPTSTIVQHIDTTQNRPAKTDEPNNKPYATTKPTCSCWRNAAAVSSLACCRLSCISSTRGTLNSRHSARSG